MKVLATYNLKGGVGKTTAAVNLAHEAGRAGARVLVWDLDPQGASTWLLRAAPKVKGGARGLVRASGSLAPHVRSTGSEGVALVPADFSLRHLDLRLEGTDHPERRLAALLAPLAEDFDVAFLDCPPSISRSSEAVFVAADALLVPIVPTPLSWRALSQVVDFLADRDAAPLILPFLSMVDRRKRLQRDFVDALARDWPDALHSAIPNSSAVERMAVERAPLARFAPRAPATAAFRAMWAELAERLWG